MADAPEDDAVEIEFEPEPTPELFVEDGGGWLADAPGLAEELNAVGFTMCDGGWMAYVRGKGAVGLGELLKAMKPKRGGEVRSIKKDTQKPSGDQ